LFAQVLGANIAQAINIVLFTHSQFCIEETPTRQSPLFCKCQVYLKHMDEMFKRKQNARLHENGFTGGCWKVTNDLV
jgi:hypothetical protein